MQIIPFSEPGSWQMQITLTNVSFLLNFHWNALNEYWLMSIYDNDANPIVVGIKVVTNFDLTAQFPLLGMPSGDIVCQNILDQWEKIQRFDMGQTNELIYYEPGELTATAEAQEAISG
jgi:hypothetical protein